MLPLLPLVVLLLASSVFALDPAEWLLDWRQRHRGRDGGRGLPSCEGEELCPMPQFLPARGEPKQQQVVPRILWQSWPGREVPSQQYGHMRRLVEMNPTYEYLLFTDLDYRQMICDLGGPELQRSFASLRHDHARALLWRLFALYTFGGVSVDTRVSVLQPFDEFFRANASVVSGIYNKGDLSLHTMAYSPRHPFLQQALEIVVNHIQHEYRNWRQLSFNDLLIDPFHFAIRHVLSRNGCTLKPSSALEYRLVTDLKQCPKLNSPEPIGELQILKGLMMEGRLEIDKGLNKLAKIPIAAQKMFLPRLHQSRCESQEIKVIQPKPISLGAVAYFISEEVRHDFSARGGRRCGFNMSMTFLERNWRPHNRYPVVLMAERPWQFRETAKIRSFWPSLDISFVCVAADYALYTEEDKFEDFEKPLSTLDFKLLCAFRFSGFLNVPALKDFRYILRLDDDSCITSSIKYDIFKELEARGTHYAFRAVSSDPEHVIKGLYDFAAEYITQKQINLTHPKLFHNIKVISSTAPAPIFLSNFEIIDTTRFRKRDIADFSYQIMDSKMIFHRRWGDAPLRLIQALIFIDKSSILDLCDFDYTCSTWIDIRSCTHKSSGDVLLRHLYPLVLSYRE